MKILIHKGLTHERWFKFSVMEQLANVGTDVARAIKWRSKGEQQSSRDAFDRALELLSLTIIDPKNKGPRRRELCRVRELLIDYFLYDNQYQNTDQLWLSYFDPFNVAAAIAKGK